MLINPRFKQRSGPLLNTRTLPGYQSLWKAGARGGKGGIRGEGSLVGLCLVVQGRARTCGREDPVQRRGRVPVARLAAVSLATCQDEGADALAKLSACAIHHRPHISAHGRYPISHLPD